MFRAVHLTRGEAHAPQGRCQQPSTGRAWLLLAWPFAPRGVKAAALGLRLVCPGWVLCGGAR